MDSLKVNRTDKFLFPNYVSGETAYILGCDKSEWEELYELSNIYCFYKKLKTIVFVWDEKTVEYKVVDIKKKFDKRLLDINYGIHSKFNISIRETIKEYIKEYNVSNLTVFLPKIIPISSENPSCVDIVENINVYLFVPDDINICKPSIVETYIGKSLSYASANSFRGVVFKCGKHTGKIDEMTSNIVEGIRSKKALCSKFILCLEFGQKSLFKTLKEFLSYIIYLRNIEKNISISIDLEVLSFQGYEPYFILKSIHKYTHIEFVTIGQNIIPYFKYKVIEYCKLNKIILFKNGSIRCF